MPSINVAQEKKFIEKAVEVLKDLKKHSPDATLNDAIKLVKDSTETASKGKNSFVRRTGSTALALPLGMGLMSAGVYATHKLKEFGNVMGIQDPLASIAVKRAVDRVVAREPELKMMDRKILLERATMIYKNAPDSFLFEPHNVELLTNILLKMKSFNGADYTLVHDISKAHKDISAARYGGAGYKDMLGVGKLL